MGKTVKMSFEGKSQQEPRNWQMDRILIILKKENGPRASSAPALGLNTIIFKHVYWYMQQTQVSVYRTIGPLVINIVKVRVVYYRNFMFSQFLSEFIIKNNGSLTHLSLASLLWDIGKQYSPRCDTAERGVPSGATLFA